MTVRRCFHHEFLDRLEAIPRHGLGLSVDIHAPALASLRGALQERHLPLGYLEVFSTTAMALSTIKKDLGDELLAYHGEGLWVTQPEVTETRSFQEALRETVEHLSILQSAWLNHECATKVLAGHYFGTYLPPLYIRSSAEIVSENIREIQSLLDQQCELERGSTPLVLLEMPPLTYFVAGTLSVPSFYRIVCEQASCGLVLDVGHLWTVFRYSGASRTQSLVQFVSAFLDELPMERVVEIHVAGLAIHVSTEPLFSIPAGHTNGDVLPAWIDAHEAPIPPVLFEMLDQILNHPRLISLKGLALEVDTKPVGLIVEEFAEFSQRYASAFDRMPVGDKRSCTIEAGSIHEDQSVTRTGSDLNDAYDQYVRVLTGKAEPVGPEWEQSWAYGEELGRYRGSYLPHEILHWGGELEDMFVESCRRLEEIGVSLDGFVTFWFRETRPLSGAYDFFLLKIERFVEFVHEVAPELQGMVDREACELRLAYRSVNESHVVAQVQ
ncbi:MAG: DUF692 domain-containing protein [Nitrospira sp.]|nr:DUF692 domain-containing protein [Nitrospira sp.]MDH4368404.1 DUF692 domain-containing protein [Nitrospira sp.]MDH5346295.1 DUF692 domain-containing protein [Nitrospira sp.]MDH5497309.1 DUF692 domain-containing protein [Nitrospira sp.]MDH5724770.1 DUF692 domain-containing protein [Nitrospira sp.]